MNPKIRPTLTTFDKTIDTAGIVLLAVLWILTLLAWYKLPDTIPVHFNSAGEPDRYGNKATLFLLPVICTAIYLSITRLNRVPYIFNYMTTITEENAEAQYRMSTRLLRLLKLAIVIVCLAIVVMVYLNVTQQAVGLGAWFLPFVIVLLIAPTGYFLVQSQRRK